MGLLLLVCGSISESRAAHPRAGIDDLKAAYIFNFIRFSEWPGQTDQLPKRAVRLQVLGSDVLLHAMQLVADQRVAKATGLQVDDCQQQSCLDQSSAVYIGKSAGDYHPWLQRLNAAPVLTISDVPGFARQGGMIEMKYSDKKLTFIINIKAVHQAGLYISAQLLQLGEVVGRDDE